MIELIFVFIVVLLGVLVVSVMSAMVSNAQTIQQQQQKKEPCRLHAWVTDQESNSLVCCECGQKAGLIQTEYDEFDD